MKRCISLLFIMLIFASVFSGCQNDFVNEKYFDGIKDVRQSDDTFGTDADYITASKNALKVYFLDVGEADCAVVICNGKVMLIDGGEQKSGEDVVNFIKALKISNIDIVLNTHAHADHIGGLVNVLDNFEVGRVIISPCGYTSDIAKMFFNSVAKRHIKAEKATPGEQINLGGANIQIIGPISQYQEDLNDTCIVLRLVYNSVSFLFTGDATYKEEKEILNAGYVLNSDVLKVGHHGSKTSSTYLFLREIMPKSAVISCAQDNSYNHPSEDVLSRLRDAGSVVYRTDQMGTIIATVKQKGKVTFETENK